MQIFGCTDYRIRTTWYYSSAVLLGNHIKGIRQDHRLEWLHMSKDDEVTTSTFVCVQESTAQTALVCSHHRRCEEDPSRSSVQTRDDFRANISQSSGQDPPN